MTIGVHWREPAGYSGLHVCGRAGLAWELLRRDRAYQARLLEGGRVRRVGASAKALEAAHRDDVARWGLCFRRG